MTARQKAVLSFIRENEGLPATRVVHTIVHNFSFSASSTWLVLRQLREFGFVDFQSRRVPLRLTSTGAWLASNFESGSPEFIRNEGGGKKDGNK
ncbi:hypothetical protein HY489_05205 [Candidatus Woesearchaeota archaeon]|nr:hypothetical protein [Candidatus Woesearchaeota archaeon]